MKKKIVAMMLASVMACGLWACGGSGGSNDNKSSTEQKQKEEKKEDTTYQSILDEYTKKIQEEAPKLVDEYNSESQ